MLNLRNGSVGLVEFKVRGPNEMMIIAVPVGGSPFTGKQHWKCDFCVRSDASFDI